MTILGKAIFICPKTGAEVVLHKDCVECPHHVSFGYLGRKPYVGCGYDKARGESIP